MAVDSRASPSGPVEVKLPVHLPVMFVSAIAMLAASAANNMHLRSLRIRRLGRKEADFPWDQITVEAFGRGAKISGVFDRKPGDGINCDIGCLTVVHNGW